MIVKSILVLCLVQLGYNVQFPQAVQSLDAKVSTCVDKAVECYYKKKGDTAACVAQTVRSFQGGF